jgi:prepilin-type processing-associated H-X9-DG protein
MRYIVALLAVSLCPLTVAAQAMVDRIPADAMLYVGWQGADAPGVGYETSHLKAIVDASRIGDFVNSSLPRLVDRIVAITPDADAKLIVPLIADMSGELWHHPSAIYFGGIDIQGGQPMPRLAILCDAGDDAPDLIHRINDLLARSGAPANIQCRPFGSVVVLSTYAFPVRPDAPLGSDADFKSALSSLDAHPVIVGYVNFSAMWNQVDNLTHTVTGAGGGEAQAKWAQIRDGLGLPGLRHLALTAGFSGRNWSEQCFIDAPAPRQGLVALLNSRPIDDALLRRIPATATEAAAGSFDLSGAFDTILAAVQKVNPDTTPQIQQGLSMVNGVLGLDLQKDFLGAFGPEWAFYTDPTAGGSIILNRPRNPDGLETSLNHLEQLANRLVAAQTAQSKLTLEIRQDVIDGTHVHYMATPLISPAWAIKDGTLYISTYPQLAVASFSRPADAPSILDNPDWQRIRKTLGGPDAISEFQFMDLPRTLPAGYQSTLMLSRLVLGGSDLLGAQSPALVVPTLDKIMAQTEPGGSIGWSDDAGMHVRSIMPFPGADVMAEAGNISGMQAYEAAMMASILLPSRNKSREPDNRVKSAANLRLIGQACLLYENDNHGKYPPDLGTLLNEEDVTAAIVIDPRSENPKQVPPNMTPAQTAAWVNQNSDYIYYGAGLTDAADPTIVVAAEDVNLHPDGCNALYADGHVEWQMVDKLRQDLAASALLRNQPPRTP